MNVEISLQLGTRRTRTELSSRHQLHQLSPVQPVPVALRAPFPPMGAASPKMLVVPVVHHDAPQSEPPGASIIRPCWPTWCWLGCILPTLGLERQPVRSFSQMLTFWKYNWRSAKKMETWLPIWPSSWMAEIFSVCVSSCETDGPKNLHHQDKTAWVPQLWVFSGLTRTNQTRNGVDAGLDLHGCCQPSFAFFELPTPQHYTETRPGVHSLLRQSWSFFRTGRMKERQYSLKYCFLTSSSNKTPTKIIKEPHLKNLKSKLWGFQVKL